MAIKAKIIVAGKKIARRLKAISTAYAPWYILWRARRMKLQIRQNALKTNYQEIPIFINNFNRLACLKLLIEWLEKAAQRRIYIVDNNSDYPPLIEYYKALEQKGNRVIRLGKNVGHLALWECGLLEKNNISTEFIYTDSDVVPCSFCPLNAIECLQDILSQQPMVKKAGLGLRLDNLPESYRHRATAVAWEEQFWKRPAAPGLMFAILDTTFALYRPFSKREAWADNLRTTYPFLADHLGWHMDSSVPNEEDLHYAKTAKSGITNWSGPSVPSYLAENSQKVATDNKGSLLHLGGGMEAFPGWTNLDIPSPLELVCLPDCSVDGIYDRGVLAGMENPASFMQALHRVAKSETRYVAGIPIHSPNKAFFDLAFNRELSLSKKSLDELSLGLLDPTQWRIERLKVVLDPGGHYSRRQILASTLQPVLHKYVKEVIIYFIAVKGGPKSPVKSIPGIKAEYLYTALDPDIDFSAATEVILGR
jgi:hypothetical protein